MPGTYIVFDELFFYQDCTEHECRAFYEYVLENEVNFELIGTQGGPLDGLTLHKRMMALTEAHRQQKEQNNYSTDMNDAGIMSIAGRQKVKDIMLGPDRNLAPFDISLLERVAVRIVA